MTRDQPYLVVAAVTAAGVLLFAGAAAGRRVLAPRAPSPAKLTTYESGVDPVGTGWAQSSIRYYLYAFLYVVFAVDTVYLFPWAVVLPALGWAGVVEMAVFLGVIAIGLLHAVRRGALRWS